MRPTYPRLLLVALLLAPTASVSRTDDGWTRLFNGKDLAGWTPRNLKAKKVWVACDDVKLDPADPTRLLPIGAQIGLAVRRQHDELRSPLGERVELARGERDAFSRGGVWQRVERLEVRGEVGE